MGKLIVTIPAYNEEKTIGNVIENIKKVLEKLHYEYKILVVDDGSTDNTGRVATEAGAIVYTHPRNYGLAETFKSEISHALKYDPDIIVHIDADGQYNPSEIPKLIKPLIKKEADLVLGSRFLGEIEEMPLIKKFGNKLFSWLVSKISKLEITDAQTGFRAFNKKVAELDISSTHTYTQEQIIRAAKAKFKIKEFPIHFAKRKVGESRLIRNVFQYGLNALVTLVRIYRDYKPLKFFGSIGCGLLIPGIFIGFYFVYLHIFYGIKGHLGLLFLMLILIFTGLQIILFGFLADMLARK